jgi:hypothetical protein
MEIIEVVTQQGFSLWATYKYERPDLTWEECLADWGTINPTVKVYDSRETTRELLVYFGKTGRDRPADLPPEIKADGWIWKGEP